MEGFMVQEWNLFNINSAVTLLTKTQWHGSIHLKGRLKCSIDGNPGRSHRRRQSGMSARLKGQDTWF